MAHQVNWTRSILDEFYRLADLNELEVKIMETRAIEGWTRTRQAMEFNISLSTLDRHIRMLKSKYDDAQIKSDFLPKRRLSACEIYLDNH